MGIHILMLRHEIIFLPRDEWITVLTAYADFSYASASSIQNIVLCSSSSMVLKNTGLNPWFDLGLLTILGSLTDSLEVCITPFVQQSPYLLLRSEARAAIQLFLSSCVLATRVMLGCCRTCNSNAYFISVTNRNMCSLWNLILAWMHSIMLIPYIWCVRIQYASKLLLKPCQFAML